MANSVKAVLGLLRVRGISQGGAEEGPVVGLDSVKRSVKRLPCCNGGARAVGVEAEGGATDECLLEFRVGRSEFHGVLSGG